MESQKPYLLCVLGGRSAILDLIRAEFGGTHQIEVVADLRLENTTQALLRRRVALEVVIFARGEVEGREATLELLRRRYPSARSVVVNDQPQETESAPALEAAWLAVPEEAGPTAILSVIRTAIHSAQRDRLDQIGQILSGTVLFGRLPSANLRWLAHRVEVRAYDAGEDIIREGDHADGLFVICWGEVQVLIGRQGRQVEVARLGHHGHFGDIALLTGQPRTATVRAVLDTETLFLAKSDFEEVLTRHPALSSHLNQVLIDTLHRAESGRSLGRSYRILCCLGTQGDGHCADVSRGLARSISTETGARTLLIDLTGAQPPPAPPQALLQWLNAGLAADSAPLLPLGDHCFAIAAEPAAVREDLLSFRLGRLLEALGAQFTTVVLALGAATPEPLLRAAMRQSTTCLLALTRTAASVERARQLIALLGGEAQGPERRVQALVDLGVPAEVGCDMSSIGAALGSSAELRIRTAGPHPSFRRAARQLTGRSVGLALGGGGARGMAHIGVVDVFMQEGVPIDLVAGTSFGAVVGGLMAAGKSARAIAEIVREAWVDGNPFPLTDYVLPRTALCSGDRVATLVGRQTGSVSIEEMPLDFVAVACDLSTGGEVLLRQGDLLQAVRASCAIPGILLPVSIGERLLVDGGLVNNLPAEPLRRGGAALVVAVDVSADPPTAPGAGGAGTIGRFLRRSDRLRGLVEAPTIIQVLSQSFHIAAREIGRRGAWHSDLCLRPAVAEFSMLDFKPMDKIVERGRSAARACLPQLREKLRALGGSA